MLEPSGRSNGSGTITTVAGTGEPGYSGDGGPATQAQLDQPESVAFDDAGNLYIADGGNDRIRMVDADGIITTVAGTGKAGATGDGIEATSATLSDPAGLAFDHKGNLYIADYDNCLIRMIDGSGIIWTVAGTGRRGDAGDGGNPLRAELDSPNSLSFDSGGLLYVTEDSDQPRVRVIDLKHRVISTFARW